MALNSVFMIKLRNNGILLPYKPSWADLLPEKYKDKNNYYFGFGRTPIVIAYNSKYLTEENSPKGWLDLIKPEYKNKFAL
jgi:iron(III) transport system substrate-binding protein